MKLNKEYLLFAATSLLFVLLCEEETSRMIMVWSAFYFGDKIWKS